MENVTLGALEQRIEPLERVVHLFAAALKAPVLIEMPTWKGWRYEQPDVRHFCVVKFARGVSAMNAAIVLAHKGYIQEICVLMRTIGEYTTHIYFLIQRHDLEKDSLAARNYLKAFFEDGQRGVGAEFPWAQIKQGTVHASIGAALDTVFAQLGGEENRTPAATLFKNVYRVFSNYVHAKYPECMDIYGGKPGHFHLKGMLNTPKEDEILAVLDAHMSTLEICLCTIVGALGLDGIVNADRIAGRWYRDACAKDMD